MSTGRRAYDVLRGYINREWERIEHVLERDAEAELNEALEGPVPRSSQVRREADVEVVILTDEQKARHILGVGDSASFAEIRKAFEKLSERSDPANFPTGSQEADQAEKIRSRVHKAFRILSDKFDPTETRFRSLEID